MKQKGSINRNFFRGPRVRALVSDLKLLLAVLFVGCESHIGCWLPVGLSDDSGLADESLAGGMTILEKEGFVAADQQTGEIFLTDFFRNNTFKTPARVRQAQGDFEMVESAKLREKILEKISLSPECGLKKTDFVNNQQLIPQVEGEGKGEGEGEGEGKGEREGETRARANLTSSFSNNKNKVIRKGIYTPLIYTPLTNTETNTGLTIRNPDDTVLADELIKKYGVEKVKEAAAALLIERGAAWPSVAAQMLSGFSIDGKKRGRLLTEGKWSGFEKKDYKAGINPDFSF